MTGGLEADVGDFVSDWVSSCFLCKSERHQAQTSFPEYKNIFTHTLPMLVEFPLEITDAASEIPHP